MEIELTLDPDFIEYIMDKVMDPDLFICTSDGGPDPKYTDERFSKKGREIAEDHIRDNMDSDELTGHLVDFYQPQPTGDGGELLDELLKHDGHHLDITSPDSQADYWALQCITCCDVVLNIDKLRQAIAALQAENAKIDAYVKDVESNIAPGEERPEGYTAADILIFLHRQWVLRLRKGCY